MVKVQGRWCRIRPGVAFPGGEKVRHWYKRLRKLKKLIIICHQREMSCKMSKVRHFLPDDYMVQGVVMREEAEGRERGGRGAEGGKVGEARVVDGLLKWC